MSATTDEVAVAWDRWDGTRYRVQSSVYTGGAWTGVTTHSDTTATAYEQDPAMAPDGTLVLVWTHTAAPSRIQSAVLTANGVTVTAEGETLVHCHRKEAIH